MRMNPDFEASAGTYYRRLELAPGASHSDIVRAYRRLAFGAHPDAHPEDPEAPVRFREISEAYEVLGNPARREAYDATTLRRSIPVRSRDSAGAWIGPSSTGEAQATPPVTILGDVSNWPMKDVPLRAGPVHIGPLRAQGGSSDFVTPLVDLLDSWWDR